MSLPITVIAPATPLFRLGQVVATPGALDLGIDFRPFLAHHIRGDWGNVSNSDKGENDFSVMNGFRILSVYCSPDGTSFWIVTEADRSATTILLPDEY